MGANISISTPHFPPQGIRKKKRSEKRTELMRAYIPADTRNLCALLSPFLSKYILLPVRSPQMRHPSTGNATAREFDYDERWLIVAFARCRREARCRVARPWLASPSILFFLSRPAPSHHAALFSKNPVPPLLLRPLQLLLLLLLPLITLLLIESS
jgi:hypothetical protein